MAIAQDISGCMADRIGSGGLAPAELEAMLAKAEGGLERLRAQYADGSLPLLRVPSTTDDLDDVDRAAVVLSERASDVVLLGTGGSSLGAQALAQISGYRLAGVAPAASRPVLHYFDNLDGVTMARALASLDLQTTKFLVVSKSGSTAETMHQAFAAIAALRARGLDHLVKRNFLAITEPKPSALRRMAESYGFPVFDHHTGIGGRFAVLTNVGLVPAAVLGLDVDAIRAGAQDAIEGVLSGARAADVPAALGAAVNAGLAAKGCSQSVMMPYTDRLFLFAFWYRQLWAESLGKNGKGTTPINSLGPVDQHSQVQLYLGGPKDKLYTVIMTDCAGEGPHVPADLVADPSLAYLAGKTIGDLQDAEQRATAVALVNNKCPTRIIRIADVDERTMGELMMHYMLETILMAHLIDVDPFDQPAVEEGKVLARKYLEEMAPREAREA